MNIIKKEVGFRYISYEIKDGDNQYLAIKSNSLIEENITVKDSHGNIIKDKDLLQKIYKIIGEFNS